MSRSRNIPRSEWETHRNTIQRVYVTEQQTLQLLMEGMDAIHNFQASEKQYRRKLGKWGFRKNRLSSDTLTTARRRAAQALPEKLDQLPFQIVISWHPRPPRFLWFAEEERELWNIKIATDTIIQGSFGSKCWKWTPDNFTFFSSPVGLGLSYRWQSLESLCTAIADLSGTGIQSYVRGSLELLFRQVDDLMQTMSPPCFMLQLVYIWRICLNLTKVKLPKRPYPATDAGQPISIHPLAPGFLCRLERQLLNRFGRRDPAYQIVSSLLFILRNSPRKFKSVLQVAYRMSIQGFESTLGSSHMMVVKMWSHYSRVCGHPIIFDNKTMCSIVDYINTQIERTGDFGGPEMLCNVSGLIQILVLQESDRFGNISGYEAMGFPQPENPKLLEDIATKLRFLVMRKLQGIGGLSDNLAVDIFVYTTKLLAVGLYLRRFAHHSLDLLDKAIELLGRGGYDCLVWASTLSKTRLQILANQKYDKEGKLEEHEWSIIRQKAVELEKHRLSTIRHAFPIPRRIPRRDGIPEDRGTTKAENARYLRQKDREAKEDMCEYLDILYAEVQQVEIDM